MATCKFCGSDSVTAFQDNGRWILLEENGDPHACSGSPQPPPPDGGKIEIPADLKGLTRAELKALADKLELSPTGKREKGHSQWRNTARRQQLEAALEAYRQNQGKGGGGPHDCDFNKQGGWPEVDRRIVSNLATDERWNDIKFEVLSEIKRDMVASKMIEVSRHDGSKEVIGRQHELFPTLLDLVSRGLNVFLVGPAGSGKTTAIMACGKALNRPVRVSSMSSQTPESRMMGYNDANGRYIPGVLYHPYTDGHLLGLDEMDNSNANVLASLNSALSNGHLGFPHGMYERHPDFICVASGNTYGMGANRVYVGRQQIDGATLDRFVVLDWPYDEAFEMDLAIAHSEDLEVQKDILAWVHKVQTFRHRADKKGIRIIISPRASIFGARLIATQSTLTPEQMENMLIWRGLDKDSITKLKSEK